MKGFVFFSRNVFYFTECHATTIGRNNAAYGYGRKTRPSTKRDDRRIPAVPIFAGDTYEIFFLKINNKKYSFVV